MSGEAHTQFSIWAGFFGMICATSAYAGCDPLLPSGGYLVFSQTYINAQSSDFQGPAGAVGNVRLNSFLVQVGPNQSNSCASLVAGGNIAIPRGDLEGGNLEAGGNVALGSAREEQGFVINNGSVFAGGSESENGYTGSGPYNRIRTANVNSLRTVAKQFLDESARIGQWPETAKASWGLCLSGGLKRIFSSPDKTSPVLVYSIDSSEFRFNGCFDFDAQPGQVIVVNVKGTSTELMEQKFSLAPGMSFGQIVFNFPEATTLKIDACGNSDKINGKQIDIPVTVLAPKAATTFTRATINGGLYVKSLTDVKGQVNFVNPPWYALAHYTPSSDTSCSVPESGFPSITGMMQSTSDWFKKLFQ